VKVYSDFAIPAFVRHVTVSIYITRGAFVAWYYLPKSLNSVHSLLLLETNVNNYGNCLIQTK
jgi:hypothetical protein